MNADLYDDAFFAEKEEEVVASARAVVPLLIELAQPHSVVDVGCGRGAWLSVFRDLGVTRLRGIDGAHVNRSRLLIDEADFEAVDLSRPFEIGGRFDLALCLEVVEHLPAAAGPRVVEAVTAAAPIVLFSAAIPGQGGTGHVNERWPRYWEDLFGSHGFARVEAIRPRIAFDPHVKWWYRQNVTLYVKPDVLPHHPALRQEIERTSTAPLEWVHVRAFERYLLETSTLRGLISRIPMAARALIAGKAFRGPNDPA